MAYFPQFLTSKGGAQLPYQTEQAFETVVVDMSSGPRHAYARRGSGLTNFPTSALWKFTHQVNVTDAELATLRTFFQSMSGRLEEFVYLNPAGNLLKYSEDFSVADWEKNSVTVGSAVADPFGGTRATTMTATSTNSNINAYVLPAGNGSGLALTASVYVKPQSAGGSLAIGFIDSGFGVLDHRQVSIPTAGQWYRIICPITLASASTIRVLIGGFSTWNLSTLHLFGAMCAPLPAENGYVKSPEFWGYHAKCRFDVDELRWRKVGPNQNAVNFAIKEIF